MVAVAAGTTLAGILGDISLRAVPIRDRVTLGREMGRERVSMAGMVSLQWIAGSREAVGLLREAMLVSQL